MFYADSLVGVSAIPEEWNVPDPPHIHRFVTIGNLPRDGGSSVHLDYVLVGIEI